MNCGSQQWIHGRLHNNRSLFSFHYTLWSFSRHLNTKVLMDFHLGKVFQLLTCCAALWQGFGLLGLFPVLMRCMKEMTLAKLSVLSRIASTSYSPSQATHRWFSSVSSHHSNDSNDWYKWYIVIMKLLAKLLRMKNDWENHYVKLMIR